MFTPPSYYPFVVAMCYFLIMYWPHLASLSSTAWLTEKPLVHFQQDYNVADLICHVNGA